MNFYGFSLSSLLAKPEMRKGGLSPPRLARILQLPALGRVLRRDSGIGGGGEPQVRVSGDMADGRSRLPSPEATMSASPSPVPILSRKLSRLILSFVWLS
ncbi:hypothetical protein BT93_D2061 [Corymbia citriodora subsp. variegata]|nr:hypothetical protein BT93_D2061 [Corymbia citriodora subsp. variegata]